MGSLRSLHREASKLKQETLGLPETLTPGVLYVKPYGSPDSEFVEIGRVINPTLESRSNVSFTRGSYNPDAYFIFELSREDTRRLGETVRGKDIFSAVFQSNCSDTYHLNKIMILIPFDLAHDDLVDYYRFQFRLLPDDRYPESPFGTFPV